MDDDTLNNLSRAAGFAEPEPERTGLEQPTRSDLLWWLVRNYPKVAAHYLRERTERRPSQSPPRIPTSAAPRKRRRFVDPLA